MSKVDKLREKFTVFWRPMNEILLADFDAALSAIIEAARQEGRNEFIGDVCTCNVMPCHFHPGQAHTGLAAAEKVITQAEMFLIAMKIPKLPDEF